MSHKYYLILNPFSGKKHGRKILSRILPALKEARCELVHHETVSPGGAESFIKQADFTGFTGVIIVGGDGTMHEVINGMLKRKDKQLLPLGLVPAGTGNAFLQDLKLLDPMAVVRRIISGNTRALDIIKISQGNHICYSFNVLGFGLAADITALACRLGWLGPLRYNIAAIIEILIHKNRISEITYDSVNFKGTIEF